QNGMVGTGTFTVPATAVGGQTGLRVRMNYNAITATQACTSQGYETEDYTVNIIIPAPCSGMPDGGTALAPDSVCANIGFALKDTGFTYGTGIVYQWEMSPANLR